MKMLFCSKTVGMEAMFVMVTNPRYRTGIIAGLTSGCPLGYPDCCWL